MKHKGKHRLKNPIHHDMLSQDMKSYEKWCNENGLDPQENDSAQKYEAWVLARARMEKAQG